MFLANNLTPFDFVRLLLTHQIAFHLEIIKGLVQGVLFRFGDPAYHFSGSFISLPLLSNDVLFSEVEGNVVQGSKLDPWGQNALMRGLKLLPGQVTEHLGTCSPTYKIV